MSERNVRDAWLRMCDEESARAATSKQSQEALIAMSARYRALTLDERLVVDRLLAEQLSSDDENVRFDALALISEFSVVSAVPALRQLASWLESQRWPGAPYEWAKVDRIIGRLAQQGQQDIDP